MHTQTIAGIENAVKVTEWSIGAVPIDNEYGGVSGTLYAGDAETIADFIADPSERELEIFGILHHIVVQFADDVFTLAVDSCGNEYAAKFDWRVAREVIFALCSVPERPDTSGRRDH